MTKKFSVIIAGVGAAVLLAGAAIAYAGGRDAEGHLTGAQADRAAAAALDAVGGGRVNAVERDGEGGHGAVWEVEVAKRDGSVVDVRLDADYDLVTVDGDD